MDRALYDIRVGTLHARGIFREKWRPAAGTDNILGKFINGAGQPTQNILDSLRLSQRILSCWKRAKKQTKPSPVTVCNSVPDNPKTLPQILDRKTQNSTPMPLHFLFRPLSVRGQALNLTSLTLGGRSRPLSMQNTWWGWRVRPTK